MNDSEIINEIESQKIMQRRKKKDKAKSTKTFRKASISRYRRNIIFLFLGSLPILILIICFIVIFYFNSKARLKTIKREQKQMEYAFEMMFLQNCLINEIASFTIRNGQATYKNNDPYEEFVKDIDNYTPEKYLEQLKDENGELSYDENRIMFNFPCEELTLAGQAIGRPQIVDMCNQYSGNKTVGLMDLLSSNSLVFLSIRDDYAKLPKVAPILSVYLYRMLLAISRFDIANAVMFMSWNLSLKNLLKQVDLVKKEGLMLTGVAIGVGLLLGLSAWGWVLITILRKPKERDQVLLLVPTKILLGNRYIRKYVLDNARGKLDNYRVLL